jgi:predicted RNase H-like HicB family nuclease
LAHKTILLDVLEADIAEAQRYAIVIEWSPVDEAYVVSVPDFPEVQTHGATREEAAALANEAIALTIAAARYAGRTVNSPAFSALHPANLAGEAAPGRRSA